MKTRSCLIVLTGLLISAQAMAKVRAWEDSGGVLTIRFLTYRGATYPKFEAAINDSLRRRWGAVPEQILWEKDGLDSLVMPLKHLALWEVRYQRYRDSANPKTKPGYAEATWGDLKAGFYWKLRSVKTDSVFYLPVHAGVDSTHVGSSFPNYNWRYTIPLDLTTLPFPRDGSAWELTLQAWDSPPPGGKLRQESKTRLTLVRARRTAPLDTMLFAEDAWIRPTAKSWSDTTYLSHGGWLIDSSKEVNLTLARAFPNWPTFYYNLIGIYTHESQLRFAALGGPALPCRLRKAPRFRGHPRLSLEFHGGPIRWCRDPFRENQGGSQSGVRGYDGWGRKMNWWWTPF